jgi:Acetyltransferase (GNAT) domain
MPVLVDVDFANPAAAPAALFPASPRSFFDLAAWYEVFSRHAVDAGAEIRLYLDESAGAPVALPMQSTAPGELRSLANYYSCEHGVLGAGAEPLPAMRGLVAQMLRDRPAWDTLAFRALDPASPVFGALLRALREARLAVETWCEFGTWFEPTAGLSFAQYVAARPSSLVNTWRRKASRAAKKHAASFVYRTGLDEVEAGIAEYEAVYGSSWKGGEPYPTFMPSLIRRAAELGALRLGVLRLEGVPAAAQMWLCWAGRATIYKLAHDGRFDALSPGTILTMRMMERVLEDDRPVEVDFGRGDDPYKKLWLTQRRERWAIDAANPRTPRGFLRAARLVAARLARPIRARFQAG